jgi:hypothetical protein
MAPGRGIRGLIRSFVGGKDEQANASDQKLPPAVPFPVDAFPEPVRGLVKRGAAALGAPSDYIAIPFLVTVGGMIGNQQRIRLKAGYEQRATLWTASVGAPGTLKSPAQDYGVKPVTELQTKARKRYKEDLQAYEKKIAAWRQSGRDAGEPEPEEPQLAHYYAADTTLEALNELLANNPGVTIIRDELVSWVKACDAYRGGRGGDRQAYLSLWAGSPVKVDRKGQDPIFIPEPVVSITGGLQPEMLGELAEAAGRRDGFLERILWGFPEKQAVAWTDTEIPLVDVGAVANILARLRNLPYSSNPVVLSPEAKEEWVSWFNENAERVNQSAGLAQGFFAKMPNQCARLALILHCLSHPDRPSET